MSVGFDNRVNARMANRYQQEKKRHAYRKHRPACAERRSTHDRYAFPCEFLSHAFVMISSNRYADGTCRTKRWQGTMCMAILVVSRFPCNSDYSKFRNPYRRIRGTKNRRPAYVARLTGKIMRRNQPWTTRARIGRYARRTYSGNLVTIASGGIAFNLTPNSCDSMIAFAAAFARE
jgi:hypothetical protein